MGSLEFFLGAAMTLVLVASVLFWRMRLVKYAALSGLLFVAAVALMLNGPLKDHIRKEFLGDPPAASRGYRPS